MEGIESLFLFVVGLSEMVSVIDGAGRSTSRTGAVSREQEQGA
jgi:hypothetical protein